MTVSLSVSEFYSLVSMGFSLFSLIITIKERLCAALLVAALGISIVFYMDGKARLALLEAQAQHNMSVLREKHKSVEERFKQELNASSEACKRNQERLKEKLTAVSDAGAKTKEDLEKKFTEQQNRHSEQLRSVTDAFQQERQRERDWRHQLRASNKRIIFVGQVGEGKSSLIRGLLLHLEPTRPSNELPEPGHLTTPKTLKTSSYFAGKLNSSIETYAFFDTRGLHDSLGTQTVVSTFGDLVSKEICKADLVVICRAAGRDNKYFIEFLQKNVKEWMDKGQKVAIVVTKTGELTEESRSSIRTSVENSFVTATEHEMPRIVLASDWDATKLCYTPAGMERVMNELKSFL